MNVLLAEATAALGAADLHRVADFAPHSPHLEDSELIRKGLATGALVGIETLIAIGRRLSPAVRAERCAALAQLWREGVDAAIDESLLADAVVRRPDLARTLAVKNRRRAGHINSVSRLR